MESGRTFTIIIVVIVLLIQLITSIPPKMVSSSDQEQILLDGKSVFITSDPCMFRITTDQMRNYLGNLSALGLNKITFFVCIGSRYADNTTELQSKISDFYEMTNQLNITIDIQSHSINHSRMTELNESEVIYELNESKMIIEKYFGVNVTAFRSPYFAWRDSMDKFVNMTGYKVISNYGYGLSYVSDLDLYRLRVNAGVDLKYANKDDWKRTLDQTGYLMFLFHVFNFDNRTIDVLSQLSDFIRENDLVLRTVTDFINLITNQNQTTTSDLITTSSMNNEQSSSFTTGTGLTTSVGVTSVMDIIPIIITITIIAFITIIRRRYKDYGAKKW